MAVSHSIKKGRIEMKYILVFIIISLTSVASIADVPQPLAMNNKTLGGGSLNAHTPGVTDGAGLNNIGLLVKTWGKVTYTDDENKFFYIDDGSGIKDGTLTPDGTPVVGIRVSYKDLAPEVTFQRPDVGTWVTVTGISSTSEIPVNDTTKIIPTLMPRRQEDVSV